MIQKQLRILALKHIWIPIIFAIFLLIMFFYIPFNKVFFPVTVSVQEIRQAYDNEQVYVTIKVDMLHYSGYDYMVNNTVKGSYYYYLQGDSCTFFLLENPAKTDTLQNVTITAKLMKKNDLSKQMITMLAQDLTWTEEGLNRITSPILVSEPEYKPLPYQILFLSTLIGLTVCAYHILFHALHLLFPTLSPACLRLRTMMNLSYCLALANRELNDRLILTKNQIYITKHFIFDFGKQDITIVPFSKIVWMYERNISMRFFLFQRTLRTNIYYVTKNGQKFCMQHKRESTYPVIAEYVQTYHPDILLGNTEEHKKLAKAKLARH